MRIIAGKHKGRTLESFSHEGTRPTADKARGAIFNVLYDVNGLTVLDLFSGTGAMAFESESRGASLIYAVDNSKESVKNIIANAKKLNSNIKIYHKDYIEALQMFKNQNLVFDLVFVLGCVNLLAINVRQETEKHFSMFISAYESGVRETEWIFLLSFEKTVDKGR